jgi:hypothetical protein
MGWSEEGRRGEVGGRRRLGGARSAGVEVERVTCGALTSSAQLGLKKFSRDRFLGAELWCSHPEFPNNVIDSTEF